MNERIKELAQNAGLISHFNAAPHRPDIERFVELLLQECVQILAHRNKHSVIVNSIKEIKETFGVEDK
jgi:hypothetical protein